MNLEKLVGNRIILTVRNAELQDQKIVPLIMRASNRSTISLIARLVDFDKFGIWIEHEDYPLHNEEKHVVEKHIAHVLIRYEFITSIAIFPAVKGDCILENHRIGFDLSDN